MSNINAMDDVKDPNPLKREPVLIGALVVYLIADAFTGTGANSTVGSLIAGSLVAALRFIVTSPATAKQKDETIEALKQKLERLRG